MKPVVYIDILFLTNFLINILLLYLSGKLTALKMNVGRIFLASAFGALYSSLMFFPNLSICYSGLGKFLSSLAIVSIAYNIKGIKLYIKALGVFYVITLCFGGGVFALFYLSGVGARLGGTVRNGVIYFNLPWQFLFASIALSYIIISGVWQTLFFKGVKSDNCIDLIISHQNRQVKVRALLDTGNSLCDPISNSPVIVTEYTKLKEILPEPFTKAVENGAVNPENANCMAELALLNKLRIIPYSSLGRQCGMLLGFRPDSVTADINESMREIENAVIGICNVPLSREGDFQALVNPEAII